MPDEELAYQEIAALYEETFGERIRAGVEWVAPLFHSCTTGVVCDPNVARCDARKETIARAVDVLATIFHGRKQAEVAASENVGCEAGFFEERKYPETPHPAEAVTSFRA